MLETVDIGERSLAAYRGFAPEDSGIQAAVAAAVWRAWTIAAVSA